MPSAPTNPPTGCRLRDLCVQWEQTFGYALPRGFGGITKHQEEMLERCLQTKDDTAYRTWRYLKMEAVREGKRIY